MANNFAVHSVGNTIATYLRNTYPRSIGDVDRANLAKYLTIAKLKLENAIAVVRTGED